MKSIFIAALFVIGALLLIAGLATTEDRPQFYVPGIIVFGGAVALLAFGQPKRK